MSFEQIILYSVALFIIIKIFFFFRRIYKKYVRKFLFYKKVLKEEWEENERNNALYQKEKQEKLIEQQQILSEKHQDTQPIQPYKADLKIVKIAEPESKWTRMVMLSGGLMKRLAQLINSEGGDKGFWQLFIKAQASTQGKYKGKGR